MDEEEDDSIPTYKPVLVGAILGGVLGGLAVLGIIVFIIYKVNQGKRT